MDVEIIPRYERHITSRKADRVFHGAEAPGKEFTRRDLFHLHLHMSAILIKEDWKKVNNITGSKNS